MNSKHQAWRRDLPSQQGICSIHTYGIIILNQVQHISYVSIHQRSGDTNAKTTNGIDAAYLPLQLQSAALPSSGLRFPCSTHPSHSHGQLQQTESGSDKCIDTSASLQVSGRLPAGAIAPTAALGDWTTSLAAAATATPRPLPGART